MSWRVYAVAAVLFGGIGMVAVYALQRLQAWLPLNPAGLGPVEAGVALNTAASFATNTDWQAYGGETTMSQLTQMLALTVQNFLSAAAGLAVLVALARGLARREAATIGNFWVDLTRGALYVLLPLSLVLALALVWQGLPQTFAGAVTVPLLRATTDADGQVVTEQTIPLGPVASQVAIKQLGTNGGGYYNANSAHPLENSTPLSNLLQLLAILLIPAACCEMFGRLVGRLRDGRALLVVMLVVFVPLAAATMTFEQTGNPALAAAGVDQAASDASGGGNMEGKEVRFGVASSGLWAAATTAASNGSVNSMHDSYTPLGGLWPLWLMQLSEVIFGGVGSGLYGLLAYAIVAVFIAGLMVGRTPEYLGKKLEVYEMKMAALVILVPPLLALAGTALAVGLADGRAGIFNPGPHGFSEALYAFSSMGNNNGSAFAGLTATGWVYAWVGGVAMWLSRYWIIVPILALAGALARKKTVPPGAGTLPTDGPLFVGWLVVVVLLVGALSFLPALALGPIVEHLMAPGL
jgi:K+-transporting ATPase ATPase A chain